MANRSKLRQLRWWRKWYESGAIRQPEIPEESRILGIATHYRSDGDGSEGVFQTLSVGMARIALSCIVSSGEIFCFVVPKKGYRRVGMKIGKIPGNAIPVQVFFPDVKQNDGR